MEMSDVCKQRSRGILVISLFQYRNFQSLYVLHVKNAMKDTN